MAKKKVPAPVAVAEVDQPRPWIERLWAAPLLLLLATVVFYWIPLTDPQTTPQWDTIDYHAGVLAYFFNSIRALHLPSWTGFTYSGFPFLADPQTGVWYPGNWILLLTSVTPKALEGLLALHCAWAGLGMLRLASRWFESTSVRLLVAVLYMFSGFFAAHSSHLGMFETAAWLPWLLYAADRACNGLTPARVAWFGAAVGAVVSIGHFQTALYAVAATALYLICLAVKDRNWRNALAVLGAGGLLGALISAVQWMPASVLVPESVRSGVGFSAQTNAVLEPAALITLLFPNWFHAVEGTYTGPPDITQFYYYGSLVLVLLAIAGALRGRVRVAAATLVLVPLWFAFGPAAGLYRVITLLPGFGNVRGPVHIWFVVGLGLALLAGSGAVILAERFRAAWVIPAITVLAFADLYYWNSLQNQLAYGRTSYEQRYGALEDHFASSIAGSLPPGTRFHSPVNTPSFGPMNGALSRRTEVTYGYNPLVLARYNDYYQAAQTNPRLLNGLNAGLVLNPSAGTLERNANVLPRFYFPASVSAQAANLGTLDPAAEARVEGSLEGVQQDPAARVEMVAASEHAYTLRYSARSRSLLVAAIPWFPGWRAGDFPVRVVDRALTGVIVPAGSGEFTLRFVQPRFAAGAGLSLVSMACAALAMLWKRRTGSGSAESTDSAR